MINNMLKYVNDFDWINWCMRRCSDLCNDIV